MERLWCARHPRADSFGRTRLLWAPKDRYNERWLELRQKPGRYRDPTTNPSFEEILAEQHRVFEKHPNTTFINAHLGWMGGDLDRLGAHLDRYPNVMTEIGAVLAELGRQPRRARQFLIAYGDRVLFGKDSYKPEEYYTYFRVLETADEYFPITEKKTCPLADVRTRPPRLDSSKNLLPKRT